MLEGKIALVWCFLSTIEANILDHPFSKFKKTNIINSNCDKSWYLETVHPRNLLNCGFECHNVEDCRRLLFCETTSECKLYGDDTDCVVDGDATECHCFQKIGCKGSQCRCPWGLYGDNCEHIVKDCRDAYSKGMRIRHRSIIIKIKPESSQEPFDAFCWLGNPPSVAILNRYRGCMVGDFNGTFLEYEEGFGIVPSGYWLGFDKIRHILNSQQPFHFFIEFTNYTWNRCNIIYKDFTLGNASTKYQFQTTTNYNGGGNKVPCGDSMTGSNNTLDLRGQPFSTYDQDETVAGCAAQFGGGWWFADDPSCSDGLLTAKKYDENYWNNHFWPFNHLSCITMKLIHV